MYLDIPVRNKKGQYARKHWRTRLDSKENRKHMFMFCLVIWSVVICADYPTFAQAGKPVYVIENVREVPYIATANSGVDVNDTDRMVKDTITENETVLNTESTMTESPDALVAILDSPESIEGKITKYFGSRAEEAKKIFMCESGLNPSKHSDTDRMSYDGRTFSVGLAQINLTVSNVGGVDCTKAFSGRNYGAKVIDEKLYKKCVKLAEDVDVSLQSAKAKFDGRGGTWGAWHHCSKKNGL